MVKGYNIEDMVLHRGLLITTVICSTQLIVYGQWHPLNSTGSSIGDYRLAQLEFLLLPRSLLPLLEDNGDKLIQLRKQVWHALLCSAHRK